MDSDDDLEELYCICRSSDTSRFMICCDHCEVWYHGDCISVTEQHSKKIKKFYCLICREKNPKLEIVYKDDKKKKSKEKPVKKPKDPTPPPFLDERILTTPPLIDRKQKRFHDSDSDVEYVPKRSKYILSSDDDDDDDEEDEDDYLERSKDKDFRPTTSASIPPPPSSSSSSFNLFANKSIVDSKPKAKPSGPPATKVLESKKHQPDNGKKLTTNRQQQQQTTTTGNKEDERLKVKNWRGAGRKPKDYLKEKNADNRNNNKLNRRKEKKEKSRKEEKETIEKDDTPKQCMGPGCLKLARKGSKYCGEECGLRLARNRILEILPDRIKQWQAIPSKADEISHGHLEKVRLEQMEARKLLDELDIRQMELESIIEKSKQVRPLTEAECNELECELDGELSMYCVTCGHEISYKNALRHMERCFNKFESQTSFGSMFKTKTEGVFCDYYNPSQKTFCRRLKVLCSEHSKDSRLADDEVCGSPITASTATTTGNNGNRQFVFTGEYCRFLKKKCTKHFCWEKLRRAELDMERVSLWLRMDDLFEQEQKIRFSMANRGGVLGLMLHNTISHVDHLSV